MYALRSFLSVSLSSGDSEQLQAISALNKLGIDAASIGLNLMKLSADSPLLKDSDKKERRSFNVTLSVKDASDDAE